MSNLIYASLDSSNICTGITEYGQAVTPNATMVLLSSFDESILGQRWTGTAWEAVPLTDTTAREWRDSELFSTDWVVPLSDFPERDSYMTYRQELRDWPSTPEFPDTKPTLQ